MVEAAAVGLLPDGSTHVDVDVVAQRTFEPVGRSVKLQQPCGRIRGPVEHPWLTAVGMNPAETEIDLASHVIVVPETIALHVDLRGPADCLVGGHVVVRGNDFDRQDATGKAEIRKKRCEPVERSVRNPA